jgi:glycerol-3-phosphate dehydrogenase (NAD(P)+)
MAKIAVVGAGMMGTALCTPLADAGHEVRLVGTHLDAAWVNAMKADRVHPKLGVPLPAGVIPYAFAELRAALAGVEAIGVGVSSAGVRWAAHVLAPYLRRDVPLVSVTKGLEESPPGQLRILPDVLRDELPATLQAEITPCAIGGPCIAGELARRVPTSVVFCGRDRAALDRLAAIFATPYYHVHVSTDVVGVEVCAALKNAYAMAVGIGAGVHERAGGAPGPVAHHNFEAGIFAQACFEMHLLVKACGGDPRQVPHLAGAGDLMVTTSGGRSSRLGRLLGLGHPFEEARAQMPGDTLESADTVRVVGGALPRLYLGKLAPGSLPLMEHLHEVIVEGKPIDMPFARFFATSALP